MAARKKYKVVLWISSGDEEKILRNSLEAEGYDCVSCKSRDELNEKVTGFHQHIGLIIVDDTAGDIPAICKELKKNDMLHSYIMVISHEGSGVSEHDALDSGADVFVTRPFRIQILVKRIDSLLKKKR